MNRVALAAAVIVAAAVVPAGLGGCGSSAPALSASASGQLSSEVKAIRAAALGDDPAGAGRLLAQLRATVTRLESQHQISTARADATLAAAAGVEAELGSLPTTTTTLPPAPPATQGHHGKGHGDQGGGGGNEG